jgi:hypothetical protein
LLPKRPNRLLFFLTLFDNGNKLLIVWGVFWTALIAEFTAEFVDFISEFKFSFSISNNSTK